MELIEELRQLLEQRTESLAVEVKRWFDPGTNEGAAKIAKGCIALRNNNGGYFIIGFNEETHAPTMKIGQRMFGRFLIKTRFRALYRNMLPNRSSARFILYPMMVKSFL